MGTRAGFWVGNPCEGGRLIGHIAWDGFPEELPFLGGLESEATFEAAVLSFAKERDDWTPAENGFPFPWEDDIFITDFNYAYFNGEVMVADGNLGWTGYDRCQLLTEAEKEALRRSPLPATPVQVRRSEPGEGRDSIMAVTPSGIISGPSI